MRYHAVLFDLFDTLVRFDRERLPLLQLNGRTVRSTAGHLHAVLKAYAPEVTLEALYGALIESWQEAERLRAIDHREVAAPARFSRLFRCLALDPAAYPDTLIPLLLETHRRELARASECPAHHRPLLSDLRRRYRLAVVSNFDYTPTAVGILRDARIADLFEAIVVSDEVGWRKPTRQIFDEALRRLSLAPGDVLFVGDRADIDVLGAQRIGMHAAWLNPGREPLPAGIEPPEFEIRDLAELRDILKI